MLVWRSLPYFRLGFTGGSYNSSTGIVSFASNDGLGFSTGDLRASYTDSDVENVLANSTGTGIAYHPLSKVFNCLITQYDDADVRTVLSSSAGTGLVWIFLHLRITFQRLLELIKVF